MQHISRIFALTTVLTVAMATPAFAQVAQAPKLTIVTPQAGQTIYGDKIPALFSVEGVQLTDYHAYPYSTPGQGHIHVWLDDQNPTAESAAKVIEDNFTFSDVPAGDHTLKAELVNNNHTSLTPPQVVTVQFKSAPAGSPAPAPSPTFDKSTAAVILVVVALVIVAAWWYTKDEEDEPKAKQETKTQKPVAKKTTKKKTIRKPAKRRTRK